MYEKVRTRVLNVDYEFIIIIIIKKSRVLDV